MSETILTCNRCGCAFIPVGANHTHSLLCGSCQPKPAPLRMADAVMSRMLGDKVGAP